MFSVISKSNPMYPYCSNHKNFTIIFDCCTENHWGNRIIERCTTSCIDKVLNNFGSPLIPKRFTIPEMFLIPKVTSNLAGCDSGPTTKSTSIYPLSFYLSFPCVSDLVANLECVCALLKSKGGINKWGITFQ